MAINKIMRAALRAASRHDLNVTENYEQTRKAFDITHPPIKGDYQMWDREVISEGKKVNVRIFAPDDKVPEHIIVFYHGGGWVTGNIGSYTNVCSRIACLTASYLVSVDYRLAPENKFPLGLMDCYNVTREVVLNASDFGLTGDDVTIMGDSAGGNLAAAVALMARDSGDFTVRKQILIYPALNNDYTYNSPYPSVRENGYDYILTAKRLQDYVNLYARDEADYKNPYFAPLKAENLNNMPKTLMLTAEFCPLRDEGEDYAKRLMDSGTKVYAYRIPDAIHGFFTLPPQFTAVKLAYNYIDEFLKDKEN